MKYLIWCVVGSIIGLALGWNGLIKGEISYSETEKIVGRKARIIGIACIVIALVCTILATLGVLAVINDKGPVESLVSHSRSR